MLGHIMLLLESFALQDQSVNRVRPCMSVMDGIIVAQADGQ
jgi:hypothetical protein